MVPSAERRSTADDGGLLKAAVLGAAARPDPSVLCRWRLPRRHVRYRCSSQRQLAAPMPMARAQGRACKAAAGDGGRVPPCRYSGASWAGEGSSTGVECQHTELECLGPHAFKNGGEMRACQMPAACEPAPTPVESSTGLRRPRPAPAEPQNAAPRRLTLLTAPPCHDPPVASGWRGRLASPASRPLRRRAARPRGLALPAHMKFACRKRGYKRAESPWTDHSSYALYTACSCHTSTPKGWGPTACATHSQERGR